MSKKKKVSQLIAILSVLLDIRRAVEKLTNGREHDHAEKETWTSEGIEEQTEDRPTEGQQEQA